MDEQVNVRKKNIIAHLTISVSVLLSHAFFLKVSFLKIKAAGAIK